MSTYAKYPYTEGNQFRTYIGQFMRVFSGLQYKTNTDGDLDAVKVVYGGMDRIIASLLNGKNDHLQNSRLPLIAVNMRGLSENQSDRRSPRHQEVITNRVKQEPSITRRMIGPSFSMEMEVAIYASSTTELFQILEQILLIFNPRITINVDSYAENGDYITDIIMTGVQSEINSPLGTDQQVVNVSLNFSVPVRLRYPVGIDREGIIELIKMRTLVLENEEILTEIDEEGIREL